MMVTVAIFAARKGWGSDAPFDGRMGRGRPRLARWRSAVVLSRSWGV